MYSELLATERHDATTYTPTKCISCNRKGIMQLPTKLQSASHATEKALCNYLQNYKVHLMQQKRHYAITYKTTKCISCNRKGIMQLPTKLQSASHVTEKALCNYLQNYKVYLMQQKRHDVFTYNPTRCPV